MIAVQNIYYMLSYAFKILRENGYRDIKTENFANTAELCAAILSRGVAAQIKRGLAREYVSATDSLSALRGELEIDASIKSGAILKRQMVCSFDEFSTDFYINQILKSTMQLLLRADITKARKKELRRLLVYFNGVQTLDVRRINWNIPYNRANQSCQMLVSVCYLVVRGLLQTQADGSTRLMDFFDEQRMCRLYEKFVLEYYRREFPQLSARAAQIPWQLDDGGAEFLPVMQSDITLSYGGRTLIIDAKYYENTMQTRYDSRKIHSENLYQIFTYVKNKQAEIGTAGSVSGLLLYAKTDEAVLPSSDYQMSGNKIGVHTLDLNVKRELIAQQLDKIAESYLGAVKAERL